MSDYHRPVTVQQSRKDRRCIACYGPIVKGEVYTQQTGFYDGRAYRNHYHHECYSALDGYDDEFCPGELPWPERLTAPTAAAQQGDAP